MADLANIDNATAAMWGEAQAERFLRFLTDLFSTLAAQPRIGKIIEERPSLRIFTAKYRNRKTAHGHRIIFQEIEGGIEVIRILHTAMYWPDHLDDPKPRD